jgi:hypothetical protein
MKGEITSWHGIGKLSMIIFILGEKEDIDKKYVLCFNSMMKENCFYSHI